MSSKNLNSSIFIHFIRQRNKIFCIFNFENTQIHGVETIQYLDCDDEYTGDKIVQNLIHAYKDTHTNKYTENWLNLNEIRILYECQYLGRDIIRHYYKILPFGEIVNDERYISIFFSYNCMWIYNYPNKNFNERKIFM